MKVIDEVRVEVLRAVNIEKGSNVEHGPRK
jgi:hypothetical protein